MEMELQEIKATAFNILKHFKQFCREQGITFYLSNGTLLGAVKYGGFIPWDDDVDVFVPREDYDRLVRTYEDSDRYRLFSIEREPGYKFSFAKLCDSTTVKEEDNIDNGVKLGIDIDIFPLDSCSEHILAKSVQRKMRWYQIGCVLSKWQSAKGKPFVKRCVIRYCQMRGFHHFYRGLEKLVKREGTRGQTHKGCLMWPIYGSREVIPGEVFEDTVEVSFEGEKFPAPVVYDTYLRSLYGDYEKDPPLEKQITHHSFRAFRL